MASHFEETGHSLLAPSGYKKWSTCPGSLALEERFPNTSSVYADEGTAAHSLAGVVLDHKRFLDPLQDGVWPKGLLMPLLKPGEVLTCEHFRGQRIIVEGRTEADEPRVFDVDDEMIDNVGIYVEFVRDQVALGDRLMVEQRLNLTPVTGEADAFGTSDTVILSGDGLFMAIDDLKYGMGVEVSAENNGQMRIYALAALEEFDLMGTVEKIALTIVQPRTGNISQEILTRDELLVFGQYVAIDAERALAVFEARSIWVSWSPEGAYIGETEYLEASSEGCRWCRAKADCPVLASFVEDTAGEGFEDMTDLAAAPINPVELAERDERFDKVAEGNGLPLFVDDISVENIPKGATVYRQRIITLGMKLRALPLLEDFIKAVRAAAERELFAGRTVDGFKLVSGRKPARKWIDEEAAEAELKKMRLKVDEMYTHKVISPTAAEKFLKVTPKRWKRIEAMVSQGEPKPTVVPIEDKRDALVLTASSDGFEPIPAGVLIEHLNVAITSIVSPSPSPPNPEDVSDLL